MLQNNSPQLQKFLFATIFTLILTLAHTPLAYADGPGDLDITFNNTGIVTTSLSSNHDVGDTIAVQSDGKIVVAGTTNINSVDAFAVVRYNQKGSLDTSFNTTGIVTTSVGNILGKQSVAIQPDGKIVLVGRSDGPSWQHIAVVRYDPAGNLDPTFNGTGVVTTSVNTFSGASDVAISNGKILVAGSSGNGTSNSITTVCYDDNGNLDSSFNGSGVVTTSVGAISDGLALAVASDGKIIVAGITITGVGDDIAVVRYNPDGSLDSDFNGTGIVTTSISNGHNHSWGVAVQPDGKIIVAGETYDGGSPAIAVVRYTITGTLDTIFNNTGIVTTSIDDGSAAADVVIQSNNKIVVGGVAVDNGKSNVAIVRYNSDGSLDTRFKSTGIVTTSIGQNTDVGRAITIQSDGSLLVAGFSDDGSSNSSIAVVRYLGDYFHYLPVIVKSN